MKGRVFICAASIALAAGDTAPASEQFAGSTPCDAPVRRFLQIPDAPPCERITWQLTLENSVAGGRPSFELEAVAGMQAVNAPGFATGSRTIHVRGSWAATRGIRSNPNAIVYTLKTADGRRSLDAALMHDNLLHLVTDDKRLMLGNGGWSYTLNRTGSPRGAALARPLEDSPATTNPPGVFEGRTPCREISAQLNFTAAADCTKLKWALWLRRDPATGNPSTYRLEGTRFRTAPRTGKWAIVRDPGTGAVIYRLDPEMPAGFLSLVRADENILYFLDRNGGVLAGNQSFSYTLNRLPE